MKFRLETAADLASGSWVPLPKPYVAAGSFFEYHVAAADLRPVQFFRLRWP
jgi:hypothetical protein